MSVTIEEPSVVTTPDIDPAVLERVHKGIEWLDDTCGRGWEDKIDLETLNIGDCYLCVLGQVFKENPNSESGFGYAMHKYGLMETLPLGFYGESMPDYSELNKAWHHALKFRVTRKND